MADGHTAHTSTAKAPPAPSNLARMEAAVARWIAEASARDDGAALLDAKALQVEQWLAVLGRGDLDVPAHLIGLSAFDLANAASDLQGAAARLRNRRAPDTWTITHAEAENAARDTAIRLTIGETSHVTTLGAFLADNGFDYEDRFGVALHQGWAVSGGGGAGPEWSFEGVDAAAVAAKRAATEAYWADHFASGGYRDRGH